MINTTTIIITILINGVPEDLPENISARFTGGLLVSIVTWKKDKGFRGLVNSVLSVPTNATDNNVFFHALWFAFFIGAQHLQTTFMGKLISVWATRGASAKNNKLLAQQFLLFKAAEEYNKSNNKDGFVDCLVDWWIDRLSESVS